MTMENKTLILGIFALLLVLPFASAFGVVTPYWNERPLIMQPGETKEVSFNLQNMVGETPYNVHVVLMESSNISMLTDASNDYLIPVRTGNTYVHMKVSVPSNAVIGTQYPITLSFTTSASGTEGVSMGTSIEKTFNVVVGQVINKPAMPAYGWAIIIFALAIIVALLLKRKTPQIKAKNRK
jgi:hypothetical protein